jgi:predicted tellurium resistance membrane protein TerC
LISLEGVIKNLPGGNRVKRKMVIIGIAVAPIILMVTLIIHHFIAELPHVLVSSLVIFSAILITLCLIGERKRKQGEKG